MSGVRVTAAGPARIAAATAAIVVPARNEADRIGACLESLAAQDAPIPPAVFLCVNNTVDETAGIAAAIARATGLGLVLVEATIPHGGVGQARRIGHLLARWHCPSARALLSTDADCVADPGWVRAMETTLQRAPAVLGQIDTAPRERAQLPESYHACSRIEAAYTALSMEFERLLSERGGAGIGLNTAGGANMGVRADVYRRVGGFRPLEFGEDRDLVDRILRAGFHPVRAPRARVLASMRSDGRAPEGMARAIADRSATPDCRLDTALAPFASMLARHLGRPASPVPVTASEAARDMPALRACVARLRRIDRLSDRRLYLASLCSAGAIPAAGALRAQPLVANGAPAGPGQDGFRGGTIEIFPRPGRMRAGATQTARRPDHEGGERSWPPPSETNPISRV